MKLIARVNVKHGEKGETAAPGEPFEVDEKTAKVLMANGSAATPADYERQERANRTAEERIAELEAEKAKLEAELAAARAGSPAPTTEPEPEKTKKK